MEKLSGIQRKKNSGFWKKLQYESFGGRQKLDVKVQNAGQFRLFKNKSNNNKKEVLEIRCCVSFPFGLLGKKGVPLQK